MTNPTLLYQNTDASLVYEFTRSPDLLKQYSELVIQYYKKDLNFDLMDNNQYKELTFCNENEYIFIVREGDRVIGGTKLSFCKPGKNQRLPLEEETFSVRSYLPENYAYSFYGEIGRLVIDPNYRGKDILHNMVAKLMLFSLSHHCGYLFVLAPRLNAVLYRRICNQLQTPATIHKDVSLPDKLLYQQLDIRLLSCNLQPMKAQRKSLKLVG